MKIIGLTGSIATGKTTVANMFKEYGFYVIDADNLAHEAYKKGSEGYFRIVETFGDKILDENGEIDRKKLGRIVLNDKEKLKLLESIVHPLVEKKREEILKKIEQEDPDAIVIYDAPLLFEKNLKDLFDCVIVVYVPKKKQIERLMRRDGINLDEARKKLSLQMDIDEKARLADIVIDNSETLDDTRKQVERVARAMKEGRLC